MTSYRSPVGVLSLGDLLTRPISDISAPPSTSVGGYYPPTLNFDFGVVFIRHHPPPSWKHVKVSNIVFRTLDRALALAMQLARDNGKIITVNYETPAGAIGANQVSSLMHLGQIVTAKSE